MSERRAVITGIGILNACGIGREAFWRAALEGRSGLAALRNESLEPLGARSAGIIAGFEPGKYVANRKSLKVMCRDIQLAVAASSLAREDAALGPNSFDPERAGVSIGAGLFDHDLDELADCFKLSCAENGFDTRLFGESGMSQLFPLWLLKYLPNMPACHISISHGLRGPSNTHTTDSAASADAFEEAVRVIERGSADLMLCGGAESKINPSGLMRYVSQGILSRADAASGYSVFSRKSAGVVPGEGGCILVLEEREHALKRKARIYAEVAGAASAADPVKNPDGAQSFVMKSAIARAGAEIDMVFLHANGVPAEEAAEAAALEDVFRASAQKPAGAASKPLTGYLGFAAAATEIALAAMSLWEGQAPALSPQDPLSNSALAGPAVAVKTRSALVNHFCRGLSNHAIVLKAGDRS